MRQQLMSVLFSLAGIVTLAPTSAASAFMENSTMQGQQTLSEQQQAVVPIAAFAAAGEMNNLENALRLGLDAGLSINEIKEILVQTYAYAGFPRSLNALASFQAVVQQRQQQGIEDEQGATPSRPIPSGAALLKIGTENQTELAGGPVKGELFDFAPAIDNYLKTHLFGDIFARDNLSWENREIATIAMLAALDGVDSQLQAHIGIGRNAGLSLDQLQQLAQVLETRVSAESAARTRNAIAQHSA